MFNSIKTSKENKDRVTLLTNKLNLGAENIIARLAFAYSLASEKKFDLTESRDSQGKEYSYKVLFGDFGIYYIAMICIHYKLHKSDKDIPKYIKMHVDDGLEMLWEEVESARINFSGTEFLMSKVEAGLKLRNFY